MSYVAAVILAAGASSRLGEPKQLATLGGERLLERAARVASEAGCSPVVVVLGAQAMRIAGECALDGVRVVVNEAWAEGMASSIRAGVAALGDEVDGAILMTCDQPAVTTEHLRRLMAHGSTVASSYAGRKGVPAYFAAGNFSDLSGLRGEEGARRMLLSAAAVELVDGQVDVDTQEGLADARARFG